MKMIFIYIVFLLLTVSCQNSTSSESSLNQISFLTDKIHYTKLDSINIVLENKSNSDFLIGLRCGEYLEMFYQKKEDNVWTENIWFWYMSLKCPTLIDTIQPTSVFNYSIKPGIFDSTGTYRLVIEGTKIIKFSNSFEIR